MAVRIRFDNTHNVISPTLVLATRSGKKLGVIPAVNISVSDAFNSHFDLEFTVHKFIDGKKHPLWDDIIDFKLVWCKEWDVWFELYVSTTDDNQTTKRINCVSLGEAELSQVLLHNIEINTEDDIAREDYVPTVLYDPSNPKGSLLHRIMEKTPHYTVTHVDASIADKQRTFTFDSKSVYDAFQEIAEELDCIFVIDSDSDENGNIHRAIRVYDLESSCNECGERGEFTDVCPKCGSRNIQYGYGDETNVFVTTENLAEDISLTTDTGNVKNCFRLEAGDDLMTSTIINSNPNGSQYLWYITDEVKRDMSTELASRIDSYNALYDEYQTTHPYSISAQILTQYNNIVKKYQKYDSSLKTVSSPIVGYPALMNTYYDTISLYVLLHDTLMPAPELSGTNAQKEAAKLTTANLSPLAVQNVKQCSEATASSAALALAKTFVDKSYQVKVATGSLSGTTWSGSFTVTSYSDDEDTATSAVVRLTLTDDQQAYLKQRIDKVLKSAADDTRITSISDLFNLPLATFKTEIQKYCLTSLQSFSDACQSCLDILIEQGIADGQTWANKNPNLYQELYVPYYEKLMALQDETKLRESEIEAVMGRYDALGGKIADGMQTAIEDMRNATQKTLDFESYLGDALLKEFVAYRREDTFSDSNYISDGLDNAELFRRAREFLDAAQKEIYKAATRQHSLSANLHNLLVMKEFEPIVDMFAVGNWIRVRIDGKIYRLRLLSYTIDFDRLDGIDVEFSDVLEYADGLSDVESVLKQAASMASTYGGVAVRAEHGEKSNTQVSAWVENGMSLTKQKIIDNADSQTQVWDEHGMLFREYDDVSETYSDEQLKIVNSTIAITSDAWRTIRTAIGKFYYTDPSTGETLSAFGVNGEVIVGKLLLGENLRIVNSAGTLSFDEHGFIITNSVNTFKVDPSGQELLSLANKDGKLLWVDSGGKLHIQGKGLDIDLSEQLVSYSTTEQMNAAISASASGITTQFNKTITDSLSNYSTTTQMRSEISASAEGVTANFTSTLKSYSTTEQMNAAISASASGITTQVSTLSTTVGNLQSTINQLPSKISMSVSGSLGGTASITLDVNGTKHTGNITLNAASGVVKFESNRFVVSSTYFGVTETGVLTAKSGTIGGWSFNDSYLYTGTLGATNGVRLSSTAFQTTINGANLSTWRFVIGSKFGVTNDGSLYASGAVISGTITTSALTASGGTIGGFSITSNGIYKGLPKLDGNTPGVFVGTSGIQCHAEGTHLVITLANGIITFAHNASARGRIRATTTNELYGLFIDAFNGLLIDLGSNYASKGTFYAGNLSTVGLIVDGAGGGITLNCKSLMINGKEVSLTQLPYIMTW